VFILLYIDTTRYRIHRHNTNIIHTKQEEELHGIKRQEAMAVERFVCLQIMSFVMDTFVPMEMWGVISGVAQDQADLCGSNVTHSHMKG